jgi:mono/diheme cytochrome c family protein
MVICQGQLDAVVPLENASMPGRVVVQWDKDDCADMGIVKVDLLGLGMMAAIQDALVLVNGEAPTTINAETAERAENSWLEQSFEKASSAISASSALNRRVVDLAHLPQDDPAVYRMLTEADTIGVFQVESRAQMATLPRLKPVCFYDIVVQVAIIRPGPIVGQMVHPYLNRRAGREPVRYPHPSLEPILARTLGVPLFQEQLLRIAMVAAGFTGGQAEELRRAMGFKRSERRMKQIEVQLRDGMTRRGITGDAAEQIITSIASFALYGFPESHAASFALLAYASAYLKVHYPAAFYTALLNNQPMGFYHASTLVKDAQRRGVRFHPIDVQVSVWDCTIEADGAIRLGLRYVSGLREQIGQAIASSPQPPASSPDTTGVINKYCVSCHSERLRTGGVVLQGADAANVAANAELWERVLAKLRAGSMPPAGSPRPEAATYEAVASGLEAALDRAWAAHPNPGRINAVHRLNRTEYKNAIRDLFALDVDVATLLPGDETADGSFDNFADVLTISTAHLERYLSVARQVTRQAVGLPPASPGLQRFEIPLHVVQDDRQSEDLPFGSRGGIAVPYHFPVTGEYLIKIRLRRQYQDYMMGMGWPQQIDVRVDGRLLKRFTIGGNAPGRPAASSYAGDGEPGFAGAPEWEEFMQVTGDAGLQLRVPIEAGSRIVAVSFVRQLFEPEGLPQPLQRGRVITNDEVYMDYANVAAVQIGGPYAVDAPAGKKNTDRVFTCRPSRVSEESACATRILSRLARLAYRRPVSKADVQVLMSFFAEGRRTGGSFESGVQFALERMLVDPDFLLRVYRDPAARPRRVGVQPAASVETYRLSDLELASRLSFFIWSSIPDDQLLTLAEQRRLSDPAVLDQQVKRMLADPRAIEALVDDFAAQWLNLRRVAEVVVDPERYPNYDLTLMDSFKQETELFVASTIREDRSVLELLNADYTFVNEKLARHYGMPGVYGSRFRRVTVADKNQRGGLLAQGALLSTTSYPDRTSPVLRGKFLLNNIFGLQIAPPPEGVDTNLAPTKPGALPPTIRERLAQHRTNPTCASCHGVIDPLGFALENFDVIGGWRTIDEAGKPVDAVGTTMSGTNVAGLSGLRALLLERPEQFPRTVTEKLLAYALGRMVQHYDRPAIRSIVRDAAAENYSWSSLIRGIVKSPAFQMRRTVPDVRNAGGL